MKLLLVLLICSGLLNLIFAVAFYLKHNEDKIRQIMYDTQHRLATNYYNEALRLAQLLAESQGDLRKSLSEYNNNNRGAYSGETTKLDAEEVVNAYNTYNSGLTRTMTILQYAKLDMLNPIKRAEYEQLRAAYMTRSEITYNGETHTVEDVALQNGSYWITIEKV